MHCAYVMFQKILKLLMWKKTGLKRVVKIFSVDFNPIDSDNILDIHKYLMKRTWYKIISVLNKKIFIGLLTSLDNGSNHTMCISLSSQKCKIQPTLINLDFNEYSHEFHYHDIIGVHSPPRLKCLGPPLNSGPFFDTKAPGLPLIYLVGPWAILDPHINICVVPLNTCV